MNDTTETELRTPPEATMTTPVLSMDDVLKHIDSKFNELRTELKAQMLSSTEVQTMIDKSVKDRPTLHETTALISSSQSALQAQFQAQQEAVMSKVETLVKGVSDQLQTASVLIAEAKGVNSNIGRLMEVLIKQHEDTTRRITNVEADTQRFEQRFNVMKTDVDKMTDDIRAPGGLKDVVNGFKTYVERQQAVATVKQEFYSTAISMLKNPIVLRVLGGVLGGATVGLGVSIIRLLGQ